MPPGRTCRHPSHKKGRPNRTAFLAFNLPNFLSQTSHTLTRIGRMTLVTPLHWRRRWMAKAVSLWSILW